MDKDRMATIRQNLNHVTSSATEYPYDHIADLEFLYTEVESLRAELEKMRGWLADANKEWCEADIESEKLKDQLATKDATICGMRKAGEKVISDLFGCLEDVEIGYPIATKLAEIMGRLSQVVFSSPTCLHKEEVEYQKKRVSELEEPMECGHFGANLQPDDSNVDFCMVCWEKADLQSQLAQVKEANKATNLLLGERVEWVLSQFEDMCVRRGIRPEFAIAAIREQKGS